MSHRKKRSDVTARTSGGRSPAERLEPARAPSRPRGLVEKEPSRFVSALVRIASGLMTLALVAMVVGGGTALSVYHQFDTPGPLDAARRVVIPKGERRIEIAERLEREGVISNRWTFVGGHLIQSMMGGKKVGELKAGEYEIKEHASMRQVMDTLIEGKSILYKTTVPEGLTSQQIVERLKAEANLTGEITKIPDEGTLLPDTYNFSKGASRQEIIDRMKSEMQKYLAALWEKRPADSPLRGVEQLVTFASIVEKETGKPEERDRVSAVFHNRLKKGMRLQSDPTIIYGLVGGQGSLGRGITKPDIESKTPYNTYQINGLPPGPICNPGRASLEAALNPAKTQDLYFVADGSGGHAFSETLKEHNSAVQKWREVERQAKSKADSMAAEPDPDVAPIPQSAAPAPDAPAPGPSTGSGPKTVKVDEAIVVPPGGAVVKAPAAGTATAAGDDIPLPTRKPKKQPQ